ncbi:MAG: hypothetical protein K2Y05_00305 [Hyphomicrobiaceae bacterium]|nr:hypothetical protein [Hyphomicrobiaceae bacterium]
MTPHRSGRGRPKGTGLDDSSHIEAIAGLISANPEMKPTTAIKELGISDPSVIRRLRDKYHASLQTFGAAEGSGPQAVQPARTMAAAQSPDPRLTGPHVDTSGVAAAHDGASVADQGLARLFGLGFGLFVSSLEAQASIFAYGIKTVPVGPFFQTQVLFTEAALQFAADLLKAPGQLT